MLQNHPYPLLLAKAETELVALRADPICSAVNVAHAIRDFVNLGTDVYGEAASIPINGFTFRSYQLVFGQASPQWHTEVVWVLKDTPWAGLNIEHFTSYLPGISVRESIAPRTPGALRQVIIVDLEKWPNMVPPILMACMVDAFEYRLVPITNKDAARRDAQALLDYFYPAVTLSFLEQAVTIGVLDSTTSDFVNWFMHHLEIQKHPAGALPTDLV